MADAGELQSAALHSFFEEHEGGECWWVCVCVCEGDISLHTCIDFLKDILTRLSLMSDSKIWNLAVKITTALPVVMEFWYFWC